ncbi:hypothetical protein FJ423_09100 [Mesorhizobium sp. B2-8-9]|nr:hypothetical protein FJ423_09100 [Mesorhizobium sp. B2-8-9]
MERLAGQHPPLACRPSPPQGEIGCVIASLFCNVRDWRGPASSLISPLAREMSGRTERGVKDRYDGDCPTMMQI